VVIYHKEKKPKSYNCPDIIFGKNAPNGLSIYDARGETLDGFVSIDNPQKKFPKDVRLTNNGILSSFETEELFYCYKGEWLVRVRH